MTCPCRIGLYSYLLVFGVLQGIPTAAEPGPLGSRVGATSLRMPPAPTRYSYSLVNAFGNLTFTDPVAIRTPPGETNRVFVVEQRGRIAVITNLAAPTRTVFLDLTNRVSGGVPNDERGLLGLAFHPGYATNGYFFVYYSTVASTGAGSGQHQRLSRFQVLTDNPDAANPDSERPVLTMLDESSDHNGGDLHFGPDGLLYVSLGDEGVGNDALLNSQRIDKDFWSSILRLDVDEPFRADSLLPNPHPANTNGPSGEINYRVPADNPFIGVTSFLRNELDPAAVRTEIFALGLRNPWRMSFDPVTGLLYCGDLGQNIEEEVNIIVKGGNYGWAYREGTVLGPRNAPKDFTSIAPIYSYLHGPATNQGYCITGGVVSRGSRAPALHGAYVFADYVSGHVWSFFFDGTRTTNFSRLLVDFGIAAFGIDPSNGDVLTADQSEDTIKRLVQQSAGPELYPRTLAETGAFADLATLRPSPELKPYEINLPFWSDNASKTRWFYIPTNFNLTLRPEEPWLFPTGSVWVKHFELELTNGVASSRRRLETRLLVRYPSTDGTDVYGITYRWDPSGTNAALVPDGGLDEQFTINEGAGQTRTQTWHYPGRSECVQCHTRVGGLALGFNTAQLNRDVPYGGIVTNQLAALSQAGYFAEPLTNLHALRALARLDDQSVSVEQRVRSYLAANCVQCHQPGGAGLGTFDVRLSRSLTETRLVHGTLVDEGGDPNARVVVPGSTDRSMLLRRISVRGARQMPPLGSSLLDTQAVNLVQSWITDDLSAYQTFSEWQLSTFGSTTAPEAAPESDPDDDGAGNYSEYLTRTDPQNNDETWGLRLLWTNEGIEIFYPRLANRLIEVQWSTNLVDPTAWHFLQVLQNKPFIPSTDGETSLLDRVTNGPARFYRAQVLEP